MSVPPNGTASNSSSGAEAANPASQNQGSDALSRSGSSAVFSPDQEVISEPEVVDWIREAFRPSVRQTPNESQESQKSGTTEPTEQAGKAADEAKRESEPGQPFRVFQTQEELDRAIQAETDRREAKRRQDDERKRERELRDKDPYEYAKLMREREEQQTADQDINRKAVDFATEQVTDYDRKVLDPLVAAVKDSEAKRKIFADAPPAMEGRQHIATGMLNLLKEQIASEIRAKLETDESFIKQILVKHGGQRADPDVVSAVGAAPQRAINQDDAMNDFLRSRGRIAP